MILIQDQERRDIARELHDELGPYLFSIRTDGMLLGRELERAELDLGRAQRLNKQILSHVDLLQQTNRKVLESLTPPGLSELGLSGALRAMVEMWRRNKSSVDVEISIDGPIDTLGETTKLTVYRIVQEGLTNAFRHSGGSRIAVDVSLQANDVVNVSVRNNGLARKEASPDGFGLKAMRERVSALSGSLSVFTPADGGTDLRVTLPAAATTLPAP